MQIRRLTDNQRNALIQKLTEAIQEVEKEWSLRADQINTLGEPSSVMMEVKLDLVFQHDKVRKISTNPIVVVDRYA